MDAFGTPQRQRGGGGLGGFNSLFSGGSARRSASTRASTGGGGFFNNFRTKIQLPGMGEQQPQGAEQQARVSSSNNERMQKSREQMQEFTANLSNRFQQDTERVSETFKKFGRRIQPQPPAGGLGGGDGGGGGAGLAENDLLDGDGAQSQQQQPRHKFAETLQKTGKQASESILNLGKKIQEESAHVTEGVSNSVSKLGKQLQEESKPEKVQARTSKLTENLQKGKESVRAGFTTLGQKMKEERQLLAEEYNQLTQQIQTESQPETLQKRKEEIVVSLQNSQKQVKEGLKHFSEDLANLRNSFLSTNTNTNVARRTQGGDVLQQQRRSGAARGNNAERWNEEDWQVRELMKKQADDEVTTEILLDFLTQNGETATYEQWIKELFDLKQDSTFTQASASDDDSAAAEGQQVGDEKKEQKETIEDRFYYEESDHRRLWNEFAGPDRQVPARAVKNTPAEESTATSNASATAEETTTAETAETETTTLEPPPSPSSEYVIDDDEDEEGEITFQSPDEMVGNTDDDLLNHAISLEIDSSPSKISKEGADESFSLL